MYCLFCRTLYFPLAIPSKARSRTAIWESVHDRSSEIESVKGQIRARLLRRMDLLGYSCFSPRRFFSDRSLFRGSRSTLFPKKKTFVKRQALRQYSAVLFYLFFPDSRIYISGLVRPRIFKDIWNFHDEITSINFDGTRRFVDEIGWLRNARRKNCSEWKGFMNFFSSSIDLLSLSCIEAFFLEFFFFTHVFSFYKARCMYGYRVDSNSHAEHVAGRQGHESPTLGLWWRKVAKRVGLRAIVLDVSTPAMDENDA